MRSTHAGDRLHPPPPPGPDLRADVVDHPTPRPLSSLARRRLKSGKSTSTASAGRRRSTSLQQAGEDLARPRQHLQHLGDADHRDLRAVGHGFEARPRASRRRRGRTARARGRGGEARRSGAPPCRSPEASPATTSSSWDAGFTEATGWAGPEGTGTSATPPAGRPRPSRGRSGGRACICSRRPRRQSRVKNRLTRSA